MRIVMPGRESRRQVVLDTYASWWAHRTIRLAASLVLIASFAVSAISGLVRDLAPGHSTLFAAVADILTVIGLWALIAGVLSFLFHFLSGAMVQWRTALAGAELTRTLEPSPNSRTS